MAVNTQLGAPASTDQVQGKYTLVRFIRNEGSVTQGATASTDLYGVQEWNIGDPDIKYTDEIFQQGGGDDALMLERGHTWPITIDFLKGKAWTQFAALYGISDWGTSGTAAMPFVKKNDYPAFNLECIVRDPDNETHRGSIIALDFVITNVSWDHPMEDSLFQVQGYTRFSPVMAPAGSELVYDQFTGDGSTTAFTLSSTPLALLTASEWDQYFYYDELYYVKEKASSASTGTFKRSGYTQSTTTLTATTAPAASTIVQVPYLKATA